MLSDRQAMIVITGIMASGKSTVAQLLGEQFDKSVHVRGDVFRRMIVNDRREVTPEAGEAELGQLRLRYKLAAHAADAYFDEGFTVIVQDVIIGPMLREFVSFVRCRPLYVVVLCPSVQAVEAREAARPKKGYGAWTPRQLDALLRDETPRIGMWLDTSAWTAERTVAEIMRRVWDEAPVLES